MAGILATSQAQGTLGTEEVPGSFLLDILLFLASLLAKHTGKPNPALPACSPHTTNQEVWRRGSRCTIPHPGQNIWRIRCWPPPLSLPGAEARLPTKQKELVIHPKVGMRQLSRSLQNAPGDQNPTRVSVSLLDWEGVLSSQEKRGIVPTEWLWG